MSTLSYLRRFIRRHDLIPREASVVVGVSGGADSLALLHALQTLAPEQGWRLHAAYLNHGLRSEAEEEARFVAELAIQWGLGCTVECADVRSIASQPGVSLEEAARQARYAFLARVAQRLQAEIVAVGHHADDQAETILMHLLRGSGLAGLRGMLPSTSLSDLRLSALPPDLRQDSQNIRLVRPWLTTRRAEIDSYVVANGLSPREDASNADTTFFRNRLRHDILPQLKSINPQLVRSLGHTALSLQGDHDALNLYRDELWERIAQIQSERIRLHLTTLRKLIRGDQRALVRRAIAMLRPELRNVSWEHSERLLDLLHDHPLQDSGGPYPLLAGLSAELNYDWLDIISDRFDTSDNAQITAPAPLLLPGQVELENGWTLQAVLVDWQASDKPPWWIYDDQHRIWLSAALTGPLVVRSRRPGDRLRVLGLGGSKAIPDLMTELKLPRAGRAHWPLLVDDTDEILWLVGQRPSEHCRLPANVTSAWEIRLKQQR
ncbi:MAG: tRNA lysidine(34) synthetase TilS [Halieaceae bacterium]|nr:tRNA lysidine(34) synthetase TilS [Halieaceae bacterium]